jgi:hypothetical protein
MRELLKIKLCTYLEDGTAVEGVSGRAVMISGQRHSEIHSVFLPKLQTSGKKFLKWPLAN